MIHEKSGYCKLSIAETTFGPKPQNANFPSSYGKMTQSIVTKAASIVLLLPQTLTHPPLLEILDLQPMQQTRLRHATLDADRLWLLEDEVISTHKFESHTYQQYPT